MDKVNFKYDTTKYTPPFRVGRNQRKAVLDSNGREVIFFKDSEEQAQLYCDYLNENDTIFKKVKPILLVKVPHTITPESVDLLRDSLTTMGIDNDYYILILPTKTVNELIIELLSPSPDVTNTKLTEILGYDKDSTISEYVKDELLKEKTMTVGELKKFIDEHNLSDNTKILIERMPDSMYKRGWKVFTVNDPYCPTDSDGNPIKLEYTPAWSCVDYYTNCGESKEFLFIDITH
jgi:hypothetical protein